MSRIKQISDSEAAPAAASLLTAIKGKIGMAPNLYRVLANEPAALKAALTFNETLGEGSFDPEDPRGHCADRRRRQQLRLLRFRAFRYLGESESRCC